MRKMLLLAAMMALAALVLASAPAMALDNNGDGIDDECVIVDGILICDDFDNRFFVVDDDDGFAFDGAPFVEQSFEQEAESGDVALDFSTTNTGDNSNVTAPALQFANTGNLQNQQGFVQTGGGFADDDGGGFFVVCDDDFNGDGICGDDDFDVIRFHDDGDGFADFFDDGVFGSEVDDVTFEGATMEFSPSLSVDSNQAVQQSSAASSDGVWVWPPPKG